MKPGGEGWEQVPERGSVLLMHAVWMALRLMGRPVLLPVVKLVVLYFFIFGRGARRASLDYLRRLQACAPELGLAADWRTSLRHFQMFGDCMVDKLEVWTGRWRVADVDFHEETMLAALRARSQGVLLIGSHLGNLEMLRALAELNNRVRLNVLIHNRHVGKFNSLLARAGASDIRLIQVTDLGPGTILLMQECLARGEWLAILGDRVPVGGGRTVTVDFLGGKARLPQGPYLLAALLGCPTYLAFCLRRGRRYQAVVEPFAERISARRAERAAMVRQCAQRYAGRLEFYLRQAPLQWFNFYPFWEDDDPSHYQ